MILFISHFPNDKTIVIESRSRGCQKLDGVCNCKEITLGCFGGVGIILYTQGDGSYMYMTTLKFTEFYTDKKSFYCLLILKSKRNKENN